jgi:hypothetical protein
VGGLAELCHPLVLRLLPGLDWSEVKDFAEERLALVVMAAPVTMIIIVVVMPIVSAVSPILVLRSLILLGKEGLFLMWHIDRWRRCARRSLNQLVQLAAIEPNPATFGAVIDLDPLPIGHDEIDIVDGTLHQVTPSELVGCRCLTAIWRTT